MDLERPVRSGLARAPSPGRSLALAVALVGSFAVLVTANSAGYRFGVSDQAFYVPAVERLITPSLFPRDAALIDSQARLTVSDDLIARIVLSNARGAACGLLHRIPDHRRRFRCRSACDRAALLHIALDQRRASLRVDLPPSTARDGRQFIRGYFHPRVLCLRGRDCRAGRVPRWPPRVGRVCWSPSRSSCIQRPADGSSSGSPSRSSAPRAIVGPALERRSRSGLAGLMVLRSVAPERFAAMDDAWLDVSGSRRYLFTTDWSLSDVDREPRAGGRRARDLFGAPQARTRDAVSEASWPARRCCSRSSS